MAFGYSSEELDMIIKPMVGSAYEAIGSMGDDTPLAVLSLQPRLLYTYFSQLFAQVTKSPHRPHPARSSSCRSIPPSAGAAIGSARAQSTPA